MSRSRYITLQSCLLAAALSATASGAQNAPVNFNRDIRPILSDKCFHCHGPDEKERKGKLRLDLQEAALKGGESGPTAIIPGKPDESEVLIRVLSKDRDEVMPPPKMHKPVSAVEADLLRRWIADGAEYQGHWAFLKPERVDVIADCGLRIADWEKREPARGAELRRREVELKAWPKNPIDDFILDRLLREGLTPSAEAPPETLVRRMTLDLTGLPPTPAEVEAFVADSIRNPQSAIRNLADRLLASPRYGEQMAARWLDMARYADSNGFQSDTQRQQSPWRDWVLGALNANMPFDRFTIEQLAGDLLPNAARDQIVATGFNRNHRLNGEGGRIVEEWFAETVIDRVETTGLTWMALTLNCCRCHDHKYDPVTQKEFYQLFAYFNSNDELGVMDEFGGAAGTRKGGNSKPVQLLPTPAQEKEAAELDAKLKAAEATLAGANKQLVTLQPAWEQDFRAKLSQTLTAWTALGPRSVHSTGGATLTQQANGSWLASGMNPPNDTYEIEAPATPGILTGLLVEVMPDASLPNQSLGRGPNGNFVLTGIEAEITVPGVSDPIVAEFTRAEADYEQKGWEVGLVVRAQPKPAKGKRPAKGAKNQPGWAIDGNDPAKRLPRKALFVCDPINVPAGATLTVRLVHGSLHGDHNIGRFRVSSTALPPTTVKLDGAKVPDVIRAALLAEPAKRTPQQIADLAKFYRENSDNPAKRAETALAAVKKAVADLGSEIDNVMVMRELPQPRDAFILNRGEYDKPGDKIARALPAALPALPPGAPNNRLGFAQWLVSGEHPLTSRVWVNRAWEMFFGAGIVRTTENFGSQAEWPTHPELLDWLATEFVRVKWDMKAMHRLMVTSATYRQSARVTPKHLEKDADNRLLARAPRLRLPAETLRDQALAVSGLLVEKLGGPSVKPYMPQAVWDETSVYGDMRGYKSDTGEGLYRRTLYTIWKRTAAPPTMLLFDSPSREICTVKRSLTNTPLQALALLNEVTYVEAARRLAEQMLTEGGTTPEARIAWAFQRATARKPDAFELEKLTANLRDRLAAFAQDAEASAKLIAQGASQPNANLNPTELAAYTVTANVLLNLDEVVTR